MVALVALAVGTANYLVGSDLIDDAVSGDLGLTAVALGWLFFVSRVMVASLGVNAVVFEEVGSVSHLLLVIPGIRRIPARYPAVARFFDLADDTGQ